MKWERPRWNKWTKIVQYGLYAFILIYALFGLDWEKDHPVAKFRDYLISSFKSVFTPLPPPESMRKTEDKAKKD
ncbi:hypothetical protein PHISCL_04604 [Aspergillus sclerotialis]|uniref:Uncharacterized protein n=1 Tax=Aspergillus sclerotialis TaxID=2070753 RepID=A0A3A2ZYT3_9EURO|nr:hypothetical protein PHISCL_04604 [Aspergillus sclerotialis]